jgi:HPt (histidine-containing phosphotransfer) domain-containing protein
MEKGGRKMIDWAQVNTLRDDVGKDDFAEIVEIFIEEVEEVINRLRNAPSLETLGDDLHFLKGSALNLGFSVFSEKCRQGETEATAGNAAQVDVPAILSSYDASKTVFMQKLPTTRSA